MYFYTSRVQTSWTTRLQLDVLLNVSLAPHIDAAAGEFDGKMA
jgi:hypothetical protein